MKMFALITAEHNEGNLPTLDIQEGTDSGMVKLLEPQKAGTPERQNLVSYLTYASVGQIYRIGYDRLIVCTRE